jgi:hypothetical protein
MIAKGKIRSDGAKLALYLMTGGPDEIAKVLDERGLEAFGSDPMTAFDRMEQWSDHVTRCKKPFFHGHIRLAPGEGLTDEQWMESVDRMEKRLGFAGQPRMVSLHVNQMTAERHLHVGWFRIDLQSERAIDPGMFKNHLKQFSRREEKIFALREVTSERKPENRARAADRNEFEQSRRLKTDSQGIRNSILDCLEKADSGKAFSAALDEHGLILANGDRRDCFVVIDQAGGHHALNKHLTGHTLKETRERLSDLDRTQLPSVEEAQYIQRTLHREQHAEHQKQPDQTPEQSAPAARGPYSELHRAEKEADFKAATQPTTEPSPTNYDRDAADVAWLDAVEKAAIAKAEKENQIGNGETREAEAHGPDGTLQPPAPGPKVERELRGTAAEIRLAWQTSQNLSELEDALSVRGISLAEVSREEAHETHRRAAFAKEIGNFIDRWREGEIVAVDGQGRVYHLNEHTTGDDRATISGKLAGIDRTTLMNVADTQEVMREAAWVAYRSERQAEREEVRRPNIAEQVIADALRSTMTGTEFADILDRNGITIARMTALDEKIFAEIRRQDIEAGTLGTEASGLRIPDILPGELAAVTSRGNMFQLSPQKLDLEEVAQRLADVELRLPSIVEARAAAEIKQEKKEEREAAFIASRIEDAELFAGKQELRQAVRGAENTVHAAFEAPEAVAEEAVRPTLKLAGIAAKVFSAVYDFAFGWATAEPALTPQQVRDEAQAAGNVETLHTRATADEAQAKEAAHDWAMHAQKTAQQEQDLTFAQRFGTPPTREANLGREDGYERERERERD